MTCWIEFIYTSFILFVEYVHGFVSLGGLFIFTRCNPFIFGRCFVFPKPYLRPATILAGRGVAWAKCLLLVRLSLYSIQETKHRQFMIEAFLFWKTQTEQHSRQ